MKPFGWIFLILSLGFVWGLAAWCYYQVLTLPEKESDPSDES
jgi:hypothetical protein